MKKNPSRISALVSFVLIMTCSNPIDMTQDADPSVDLGEQTGSIQAGAAGSATYAAVTTNVAEGAIGTIAWYADIAGTTPASVPTGVTPTVSSVSGNAAIVTMSADATAIEGTYYFRLTEGAAVSDMAALIIGPVPAGTAFVTVETADPSVSSVSILIQDGYGAPTGSGSLTKGASSWRGLIDVSATGTQIFKAYARSSGLVLLYYGTTEQSLTGSGDSVTITVGSHAQDGFDFTSDPGWTAAGDWTWGTPDGSYNPDDGFSEPGAAYGACYGTDFSATGSHDGVSRNLTFETNFLQTGPIDMSSYTGTGAPGMQFKMWFENDFDYDFGKMIASTDGSTWNDIDTVSPSYHSDSSGGATLNSWTYVMNGWATVTLDLSAYASATRLYIRWVYQTDDYDFITFGWYVDDVTVGRF